MSDHSPDSSKTPDLAYKLGLSIDEGCEISGVGRTKIYEAIGSGELIARKVGRRTVILRKDLEVWLDNLPAAVFASGEADPGAVPPDVALLSCRTASRDLSDQGTPDSTGDRVQPKPWERHQ